VCFLV